MRAGAVSFANGSMKAARWSNHLVIGMAWTRPQAPHSKTCGSQTWAWSRITQLPALFPSTHPVGWEWSCKFAFLRNSQMVLMLLALRKHFEENILRFTVLNVLLGTPLGPPWVCGAVFLVLLKPNRQKRNESFFPKQNATYLQRPVNNKRGIFAGTWPLTALRTSVLPQVLTVFFATSPTRAFLPSVCFVS